MKKNNLTTELILSVNSKSEEELCKSRYFSGSFINSDSGQRYDRSFALSYLNADVRLAIARLGNSIINDKAENRKALKEAMQNLDYLSSESLVRLNTEFKSWLFFNKNIDPGLATSCSSLFILFQAVKLCTEKTFYQELKWWASENQYKLTFKNRGVKRKVILEL